MNDSRYAPCPICGADKKARAKLCRDCSDRKRRLEVVDGFWDRVDKTGSCWLWQGHVAPNGYGRVYLMGRTRPAHRVAWEATNGPVPDDLTLDHLCRNRACVNPDHLEPITMRENLLRGIGASARNARKTTCPRGHRYDRVKGDGSRWCARCDSTQKKARKALTAARRELTRNRLAETPASDPVTRRSPPDIDASAVNGTSQPAGTEGDVKDV